MNATTRPHRVTTIVAIVVATLTIAHQCFAETAFTVPPGRAPSFVAITMGPDHNLWFTENTGLKIGRITPAGVITEFPISGAQALCGITSGPDGNIWFTDEDTGKIGHINTSGGGLVMFSIPGHPQGITTGPDGKLWFVDEYVNPQNPASGFRVGSITVSGTVTEYLSRVNPGVFAPENYWPAQITKGPDGNLWFTNPQANQAGYNLVGKITTAGAITIYNMADTPLAITSGPDGNLWVTENGHVAKISTSGGETETALTVSPGFIGITTGPDGNIWFTEDQSVGYITPSGALTEFPVTNFNPNIWYLSGIATGTDGNLWILGNVTGNIGKVSVAGQLLNSYNVNLGSWSGWNTLGPDGAIWATQFVTQQISRIATNGVVTSFPVSLPPGIRLGGITGGSDGNIWFPEFGRRRIAKMSTAGTLLNEYVVGRGLWTIVSGPDGNLWFPEISDNNIARLTTSGVLTEFPIPTAGASAQFITLGTDGNLWFTENATNNVGKINPNNGLITEYSPFTGNSRSLGAIVYGPDGNLWMMENTAYGAIAKVTTAGTLLGEYPAEVEQFPEGLVAGPDGAIWFAQAYPNSVGRISTSGVVTSVPLVTPNAVGNDLAVGSDHKLWIAEGAAGMMGRMSAIGGTGSTFHATHGTQFHGTVASFVDGTTTATNADFTATINWGDGTQSSGTVSGSTGGPFTVTGTHTYGFAWNFNVVVTLHDNVDNATYTASTGSGQVN